MASLLQVMRKETLRHSIHFIVKYSDGSHCDFFMLRGEWAPTDFQKAREVRSMIQAYQVCYRYG